MAGRNVEDVVMVTAMIIRQSGGSRHSQGAGKKSACDGKFEVLHFRLLLCWLGMTHDRREQPICHPLHAANSLIFQPALIVKGIALREKLLADGENVRPRAMAIN
jgi:hypothetical protein